jgi:DNA transformation protein and related proteins
MPVTPSYLTFVLDQLAALPGISSRKMFGGVGVYYDGLFFGAVDDDTLYLRVDDSTRPAYRERGSTPLRPVASKPDMVMEAYYEVPGDILDDPEALHAWAHKAIEIARANPSKKKKKKSQVASAKKPAKAKPPAPTRKAASAKTARRK